MEPVKIVDNFFNGLKKEVTEDMNKATKDINGKIEKKREEFLILVENSKKRQQEICKNQETCPNFEPIKGGE